MWFAGQARRGPDAGRPKALRPGFHLERGQRVGLFGGSFNPPHSGHAHVARTAMAHLDLDRVLWLVSPQNPLKPAGQTADLSERMAQTREVAKTACQGLSMIVSDVESRIQARYTIDTLRALKARHPGVQFVWIMGADNLAQFHRWRGWLQIMHLMPVAVIARPGSLLRSRFAPAAKRFASSRIDDAASRGLASRPAPAWVYLNAPLNHVSSSAIRAGHPGAKS
jgi:nicotinate-nucleotide adenylyltransferase